MNLIEEIQDKPVKMRIRVTGGGPFGSSTSTVSIITRILGVDPVLGVWKLSTDSPDGEQDCYFLRESIESFLPITEDEPLREDEKWYGSLEAVEKILTDLGKETEVNG